MPTTYNGIGTHYYGKKDLQKRQGVCPHCNRPSELTSYTTRLWFVFLFIPIFPLGRKRILDQCPICTRHYVLELDKWETAKQLEISGALEKYRTAPSPDSAIEAHQMLVKFHQTAEAGEFRGMMRKTYADNAKVHAYLGAVLDHLGQFDEAAECHARALELRPDLPESLIGVGEAHLRAGRLEDAARMFEFLTKPGAGQLYSLDPLETLAQANQRAGHHEEALRLFEVLLRELPPAAEHTAFRKAVEKSEKALQRKESLLPKRKFSWRRLFSDPTAQRGGAQITWRGAAWVGVLVGIGLLLAVVRNEYVRRHRTLHIVNSLNQPATVEIRGLAPQQVYPGTVEVVLPEGSHHATIRGPAPQEVDFDLRTGFFDRWFNDPVWALNVGGASIFVVTTATYRQEPTPPSVSVQFGDAFVYFPNISHPFKPLPESVRVKSGETRTLTQVEVHDGTALDVVTYLDGKGQWSEACRLIELRLKFEPANPDLLRAYLAIVNQRRARDRAEGYLRTGLTNRPVRIEWHRAYQSLAQDRAHAARLAAEYDQMLQAAPDDSALLYLRGRVAPNHEESLRFFDRASAADPNNPYPLYAHGYDRMTRGDWAGARTVFERAVALQTNNASFSDILMTTRLALQDFAALEAELRARLQKTPLDLGRAEQLCDVLVAAGNTNGAEQVVRDFQRAAAVHREQGQELANYLRRRYLYLVADFAGLEQQTLNDRTPAGRMAAFQALIELGRVADALNVRKTVREWTDDSADLAIVVALAWAQAGNLKEAAQWQARAVQALEIGDDNHYRAAELLRSATPPGAIQIDAVALPPEWKAPLLALLAHLHPTRKTELLGAARRLNVDRGFPYHLVRRATAVSAP